MNFATATAPSNAFARVGTFPPPSPIATASAVSSSTSGSVRPLVAAARNSSTIRRAAASSISVRVRPSAMCFLARWNSCWLADSVVSRISAIFPCGYANASRSTYTARSLGDSRSMRARTAYETDSRCSTVSAGPSIGSPASSGSGSHWPT